MKNKKQNQSTRGLKLAAILESMPLYRFMDESRAILLKLQPAWKQWIANTIPTAVSDNVVLLSFASGVLTVATDNSTTATLLKNYSKKATEDLKPAVQQLAGLQLEKIKIQVHPEIWRTDKQVVEFAQQKISPTQSFNVPNDNAIRSIELLQKSVKNTELSSSLDELIKTLNDLKDQKK